MALAIEAGPKPVVLNVSFSSNGDNTVIAALPNQIIRVISLALTTASAITVGIKDGTSTTLGSFQSITSLVLDPIVGHSRYILTVDNALVINLSSGVSCTGTLWYVQN